jgi:hypothetical protein
LKKVNLRLGYIQNMDHRSPKKAALVFSADLTRRLSTAEMRLPPTYVGVRRIRPSNSVVKSILSVTAAPSAQKTLSSGVTYKIKDAVSGEERRMTAQEKKQLKNQLQNQVKEERKEAKRKRRLEKEEQETDGDGKRKRKTPSITTILAALDGQDSRYLPFQVDPSALEQELADLRGERDGVPPVVLAPPMARLALDGSPPLPKCVVNDDLAGIWASAIKKSMVPAETVRRAEDLRPMVYDLLPEVWSRVRPPSLGKNPSKQPLPKLTEEPQAWSSFTIRDTACTTLDSDLAAVAQVLHEGTNLHVSCGAKFGCDYLLYNAPREECHAFAGLRILKGNGNDDLPLPTTYDMTGYVRCLNTAAKLALLAFVQRQKDDDGNETLQVAFVDLPLIKIASTSGRSR